VKDEYYLRVGDLSGWGFLIVAAAVVLCLGAGAVFVAAARLIARL
jgi:hypothetical protein